VKGEAFVPISFSIPLPGSLGEENVHVILANGKEQHLNLESFELEERTPTACGSGLSPAGSVGNPRAQAGHLCVYVGELTAGVVVGMQGFAIWGIQSVTKTEDETAINGSADAFGARLAFSSIPEGGKGSGSWAVTGP
jgi:hypothetical protein